MQIGLPSQIVGFVASSQAEYTIYAYDRFNQENLGGNRWQRVAKSPDPEEAVRKAEQLFFSNQYQKIEIKRKIYNDKTGQHVASTYRIFQNKPKNNYLVMSIILLLAFSSAGLFYLKHM